jgi:hypothetical protein
MAQAVTTGSAAPGAAATGAPNQRHSFYALTQNAFWLVYLASTNQLAAKFSTDGGATWSAPASGTNTTSGVLTLTAAHNSEGRNFGFGYAQVAGVDVLHMCSTYNVAGATSSYHARFTLGSAWNNTHTEANVGGNLTTGQYESNVPSGCTVTFSNSMDVADANPYYFVNPTAGAMEYAASGHAEAGTSWTAGGWVIGVGYVPPTQFAQSTAIWPTAAGGIIQIIDDGSVSTHGQFKNLMSQITSAGAFTTQAAVFASDLTQTDNSGWGSCQVSETDLHVLALSDNNATGTYHHRRWNGTSWSDGDSVPTLPYGTTSGIAMVPVGTTVYAAIFDTSKRLQTSHWVSGTGWSAWSVQESARPNAPSYITGAYDSGGTILWTWTEHNGSNYEIWSSAQAVTPAVAFHAQVTKHGLLGWGLTNAADTAQAFPTAISGPPTVRINGSAVSLYGPVSDDFAGEMGWVFYQALDGGGNDLPILSTDVVDFTWAGGSVTTTLGRSPTVPSPSVMANFVGRYEDGHAGLGSMAPTKRGGLGFNLGQSNFVEAFGICYSKNARLRLRPNNFIDAGGANAISYNPSTYEPLSWTAGGVIKQQLWDNQIDNGINGHKSPTAEGDYYLTWTDVNATNPSKRFNPYIAGDANVGSGYVTTGGATGNAQDTYNGNNVIRKYTFTYNNGAGPTYGWNMGLWLYATSPQGKWAGNDSITGTPTVTNFKIYFPGDTPFDSDAADPYAICGYVKAALKAANGNGPGCVRFMEQLGYDENYVDYSDCQQPTNWCYGVQDPTTVSIPIVACRFWNTNPAHDNVSGDSTYLWAATPKFHHSVLGVTGSDSNGPYLDLTAGYAASQNGAQDCGKVLGIAAISTPAQTTAVVEFRTSISLSANGVKSGFKLNGPGIDGSNLLPWLLPVTGSPTTAFSGTWTVSHGSQTVQCTSSQTFWDGQGILFDGTHDTTGQCYRVRVSPVPPATTVTVNANTNITIEPAYQGSSTSSATATRTGYANINSFNAVIWVTTDNTFIAQIFYAGDGASTPSGTAVQTLSSTKEILIGWNLNTKPKGGVAPYGWAAATCGNLNSPRCHVPFNIEMTTACLNAIADEFATNAPNGLEVIPEVGLEHWNQGSYEFPAYVRSGVFGSLMQYISPGTAITSKYNSPGSAISIDAGYTVSASRVHETLKARFDSNWSSKGIKVAPAFGSFVGTSSTTDNMVAVCNANGIPFSYNLIAPYLLGSLSASTTQAFGKAGEPGITNPGTWPARLIIDLDRYVLKYAQGLWPSYSSHYHSCQNYTGPSGYPGQVGGKPVTVAYECGIDDPTGKPANIAAPLHHDIFYSPGMYDLNHATWESYYVGDPTTPGSGLPFFNDYHFGGLYGGADGPGQRLFQVTVFQGQPAGDGSTNQYTTAQGGSPGDGKDYTVPNNLPALKATTDWIFGPTDQTTSVTVSPGRVPPKRSTAITLHLTGVGTSWTSGSSVSIQNSVSGPTTTVTKGTWTAISATSATLTVTTSTGIGRFTVTVDGVVSNMLSVSNGLKGYFAGLRRLPGRAS